ncbi:uncharacterized protein LOC100573150 [Acyrthosiphon pisum]|uniref:Enkurin domain-containing protein n=1 Tax=Acyrthosiphon pisum TaxID=7029 RepID=A0A8R1W7P8_ACYPI|nr:uncharacterized protein LOC100573150 [Acyrthosiphon pisum]|eukprot:XP_003243361.1 PREDICTED: uncharacterized protein LOC100573150 [Acyrthosiphon pisum]
MCSIRDFFPIDYRVSGAKPRKNFILENKRYVTKLGKDTQTSKENVKPSNKLPCTNIQNFKLRQGTNKETNPENSKRKIKSIDLDQIDASIKSIRSAIAQTKITQKKLGIKNIENVLLTFRDQATQTVNPYEEEGKLNNNIIRNPILQTSDMAKTIQTKHMNTISVSTENSESEYSNVMSRKNVNSVHQQDDNNSKRKQQHLVGLKENIMGHHQPGEIPKYLKDRKALKEKNEKEVQKKLAIRRALGLDDPACPPGHVLLPEPERLEHLAKIKKDYNQLVLQLNMLPVGSDSYKMKEKRKRIEKELDQVQLGIKLFSKEKLYVKINQKMADSYK